MEIIPRYGEGFWFVIKAHPSAHIEICAGGCNAEDGPKDKQDVELFFAEALKPRFNPLASIRGKKDAWADGIAVRIDLGNSNFLTNFQSLSKMGRVVKKIIYLSKRFSQAAANGRAPRDDLWWKQAAQNRVKSQNGWSMPALWGFASFRPGRSGLTVVVSADAFHIGRSAYQLNGKPERRGGVTGGLGAAFGRGGRVKKTASCPKSLRGRGTRGPFKR